MIKENEQKTHGVPEMLTVGDLRRLLHDQPDDTKLIVSAADGVTGWTQRFLNALGDLNNAPDGGSDGTKVLYLSEDTSHEEEVTFTRAWKAWDER